MKSKHIIECYWCSETDQRTLHRLRDYGFTACADCIEMLGLSRLSSQAYSSSMSTYQDGRWAK